MIFFSFFHWIFKFAFFLFLINSILSTFKGFHLIKIGFICYIFVIKTVIIIVIIKNIGMHQ